MGLLFLDNLDLAGKKVLLRLDLNVPIKNGKIKDNTRIKAALPTINHILEHTDKLAIMSHLGRPKKRETEFSLEPVGAELSRLLGVDVVLLDDCVDQSPSAMFGQLRPKQIILIENIRFFEGETKNDPEFAKEVAKGFDFYVNDAFGAVHRAHASTVAMAECFDKKHRAAGYLIREEIDALSALMKQPKAPFTVIVGGAKVADKIGVMLNLINKCNHMIIGGAMAYTFLKYRGIEVGASRVEEDKFSLVESIYRNAEARKVQIHLPVDHVAAEKFDEQAAPINIDSPRIPEGLMALDIGPETVKEYKKVISDSRTILWNGPMGVFEWPAFAKGSIAIAKAVADCSGKTLVGGGDSVALVQQAGVGDQMDHISTGGGASIEFLEGKSLPGIKVLSE
jgi:phosphoglycerate kinase